MTANNFIRVFYEKNPVISVLTCSTNCDNLVNFGRDIQFRYVLNSPDIVVGQYIIPNKEFGWPKPDDRYLGVLRLEKRFCGENLLKAIDKRFINVEIGDRILGQYVTDSIHGF